MAATVLHAEDERMLQVSRSSGRADQAGAGGIDVTLIFCLRRYDAVMDAFLDGMERRRRAGLGLTPVASVGSFLVSRVDTKAGSRLDKIGTSAGPRRCGAAAIANARLACQHYEKVFAAPRVGRAARRRRQAAAAVVGLHAGQGPGLPGHSLCDRPRRARRGQHNARGHPAPGRRHGQVPAGSVHGHYDESRQVPGRLQDLGIDGVVQRLEDDGVAIFDSARERIGQQLAATRWPGRQRNSRPGSRRADQRAQARRARARRHERQRPECQPRDPI